MVAIPGVDARPPARDIRPVSDVFQDYQPLLAYWLVKSALLLDWKRDVKGFSPVVAVFTDDDFLRITGLPTNLASMHYESRAAELRAQNRIERALKERCRDLDGARLSSQLPLFRNIALLAEALEFTDADKAVLVFSLALSSFFSFRAALLNTHRTVSTATYCKLLQELTGVPHQNLQQALAADGTLVSAGLIEVDHGICEIDDKIDLMEGLEGVLLVQHENLTALMECFMQRAPASELRLEHFPHLAKDSELLERYLRRATKMGHPGTNVLLYGVPGVGKTEFARALAQKLGLQVYEIAFADKAGVPIRGQARLRAYVFCQRLLARRRNTLLLFDEVEDVFPPSPMLETFFMEEDDAAKSLSTGKAWVNRTLEENPVPAIWISNHADSINPAYRRRFDYSVRFPIPPKPVRRMIGEYHLGRFRPSEEFLDAIAANEHYSPAQLGRAAKVAAIICGRRQSRKALEIVSQTLSRSSTLLGQRAASRRPKLTTEYDLRFVNANLDFPKLIEGLRRQPRGTFCFYGPAGTGKSELARYIADRIGKPILFRRASDLLSKWVGGSERNISEMFEAAQESEAVLILDEADTFLGDRRGAHHSWEISQVNEMLTQMESFEGIFICTTNLMDKLDTASLRRFAFKVRFDYLTAQQRVALFRRELVRQGGKAADARQWVEQVRQLDTLTPGDFAAAMRQLSLFQAAPTAEDLVRLLRAECRIKNPQVRPIGFAAQL